MFYLKFCLRHLPGLAELIIRKVKIIMRTKMQNAQKSCLFAKIKVNRRLNSNWFRFMLISSTAVPDW